MAAAELVRGQNHPLPGTRISVRVSAAGTAAAAVLLTDDNGRLLGDPGYLLHERARELPGVRLTADGTVEADLDALPDGVRRVLLALVLPADSTGFGAQGEPRAEVAADGGPAVAAFTLAGLGGETAVVAVELYARGPGWKVRAVGQGYQGGAAALLADHHGPAALAPDLTPAPAAAGAGRPAGTAPTGIDTAHPGRAATPPADAVTDTVPGSAGIDTVHPRRRPTDALPADAVPTGTAPTDAVPTDTVPFPSGIDTVHPRRRLTTPSPSDATPADGVPYPPGIDTSHPGRPTPPPMPSGPPTVGMPSPAAAVPPGTPPPVAGDAAGFTMDERLYNQVWGVFEDAARSAAAYRSAVDFADQRESQEVEALLSDPRARFGTEAESGRAQARARRDDLEGRAREVRDRDSAQLLEELRVVEAAMPAPMARWDSPAWSAWQPPEEPPFALRLGDLHLPENPDLRVPMLVRFPSTRGLWVDTGSGAESDGPGSVPLGSADRKAFAAGVANAAAARMLACYRPGGLLLHAVTPGGDAAGAVAPFARAGLLSGPPATDASLVTALLEILVERVDLVQMARRAGAPVALPPHIDPADRLLLVHDFPYGFDDRTLAKLRYLAEEGPSVGVHLLVVADRADGREYGPLLDSFFRSMTRLAPVAQDYLADPWVEHLWTFTPAVPAPGDPALPALLDQIARGR
ncbi:TerD family protein [Kitasatospora sp. NPDC048365]|uniref:TerD family protein n=1 Tax=Kitasatospora sp. NPDC048365 TaxID=3364050 RepID=UPI00371A7A07